MESGLQAQIEKLEAKLKQYRRENEELRDKNTKSEILIKLRQMTKERKEQIISDQNNHIEKLYAQIKKLKDESDFNQRRTNQDIKKEISDYEVETIRLNKIINNKDEELTHIRQKLTDQESVVDQYRQQIKVLQQQNSDSKKEHKLEIAKSNKIISNNSEEIFRLRNHNKTLITKIKKLKNNSKRGQSGEDLEGKLLEKQEENQCLNNSNQELHNQIKELEIEKKSQEERIERIPIHEQSTREPRSTIQENTSKNQIEEVKTVLVTVQRKEEQTKPIPYRHPNYNRHFDQRQGQNEYSQKTYVDMRKYRHTKQQSRQIVPQKDLRAPIKIDLGWTTGDAMRQFSWGIRNSYRLISSNVANTKWKEFRDDKLK